MGSHKGAGFDNVVRQIADAFERALAEADPAPDGIPRCPILIENAAGNDGPVGRTFEEIGLLIDACNGDDRLGLCIDTQHLWASGFDYSSIEGTERLIKDGGPNCGPGAASLLPLQRLEDRTRRQP